jgi:tetratricopeptide (TPR) repeat protein
MGVTFLAVAGWSPLVRAVYSPPDPALGMDPERQVLLMRSDPAGFLLVLWRTALRAGTHVGEYLGTLGWLDTPLPAGVLVAEAALLLAVCAAEFGPWSGVTARQALLAAGVALLVALTVLVVMHIIWDVVGSTYVEVQGRHFIPAGPLVGLAVGRLLGGLVPQSWRVAWRAAPGAVALAVPVLLAASLARACDRYYADSPRAAAERAYARARSLQREHAPDGRVREKFEEALRLNPDHVSAHFFLGQLLEQTRPRDAADHYRAALRGHPGDPAGAAALGDSLRVVALNNLAGHVLREGDAAEAIRLFREALRIDPGNANVKGNLARALRSGELETALRQLPAAVREAARAAGLSEERHPGTPLHGLYLRPARGPVVAPLPAPFVWRSPPPCGGEPRLDGPAAAGAPFFACSAGPLPGPKRVFVFPDSAALLADEEVSWYYQRRLAELSAAERERESAYRRERGLRFPLATPPD